MKFYLFVVGLFFEFINLKFSANDFPRFLKSYFFKAENEVHPLEKYQLFLKLSPAILKMFLIQKIQFYLFVVLNFSVEQNKYYLIFLPPMDPPIYSDF